MHDPKETARVEAGGARWPTLDALCDMFPRATDIGRSGRGLYRARLEEGLWVRFELYDTFHTYTFFSERDHGCLSDMIHYGEFFADVPLDLVPLEWLRLLPEDSVIVATHLELIPMVRKPSKAALQTGLGALFEDRRVYGSDFHGGQACAFTDFKEHEDKFARVLVLDKRLEAESRDSDKDSLLGGVVVHSGPGRLVRQLLSVEVFRSLSLVGEPWAGHLSRQVEQMNKHHVQLMGQFGHVEKQLQHRVESTKALNQDTRGLLDELCNLHVMLEELIAKSRPRLERSHVWYLHMRDLMQELREQPLEGFQRIGEFTRLRVEALERDRMSLERETQDMSARLHRSGELLKTRVTIGQMEAQHNTAKKVERLTVVAIVLSLLLGVQELHSLVLLWTRRLEKRIADRKVSQSMPITSE